MITLLSEDSLIMNNKNAFGNQFQIKMKSSRIIFIAESKSFSIGPNPSNLKMRLK